MVDLAGDLGGSGGGAAVAYYGAYAGRPAAGTAGRMAWLTDSPTALWVDDGTKWRPYINGMLGVQPPLVGAFTAFNAGAVAFSDLNGAINVLGVNDGASPGQLRGLVLANAAATAYARATFQFTQGGDVTANHFAGANLLLREAATAKAYAIQIYQDYNGRSTLFLISTWTSNTVRSAFVDKGYAVWDSSGPVHAFRVRRNGANLFAEFSRDGNSWVQFDTRATGTVFTTAPDQAGFAPTGINCIPQFNLLSFESGS